MKSENLILLLNFQRKAPRKFARASANTLNSFAFGNRRKQQLILKNRLNVKNEKFVKSALRVQKASTSAPMESQVAISGSIFKNRFSGWREQELGVATDRSKTSTLFGRGGGRRQLAPSARMKPGRSFTSPDDFEGKNDQHRVIVMLNTLSRTGNKKPFFITGHRKFKSGLYKFRGKKIKRLQTFKNKKQPKRLRWLTLARQLYFSTTSIGDVWADSLRRVLRLR